MKYLKEQKSFDHGSQTHSYTKNILKAQEQYYPKTIGALDSEQAFKKPKFKTSRQRWSWNNTDRDEDKKKQCTRWRRALEEN